MSESDPILEQRIRAAIRLSRVVVNAIEESTERPGAHICILYPEMCQAAREYEELDRLARAEATR